MSDKKEIKRDMKMEYAQLLASGMLWELFPCMTGNWDDDKDIFVELTKDKVF